MSFQLNVTITDAHRSLSAIENINSQLVSAVLTKYFSETDISSSFGPSSHLDRLENILSEIFTRFDNIDNNIIEGVAEAFMEANISDIEERLHKSHEIINKQEEFLSINLIRNASAEFLNFYFENKGFPFSEPSKEYIKNLILNPVWISDRAISSGLYWEYNSIGIGDKVRMSTSKGETLGIVQKSGENLIVRGEHKEYKLTSAWHKLSTRLGFDEISLEIFSIIKRLLALQSLLKTGPAKGIFCKYRQTIGHNRFSTIPVLILPNFIEEIDQRQLVLFDNKILKNQHRIINFFNLGNQFDIEDYSSEAELIDSIIRTKVIEKYNEAP